MDRTKLRAYAPQAHRDFIQAVTARAGYHGLTATMVEPIITQGEAVLIGGKAFPRTIARKRKALEERIARHGFEPTMEAMAYTWFNRFAAIRFMELYGYLDHGYRVLSHPDPEKPTPEILEHAEHVDLPGLSKAEVIDLKLDGTREAELYRMLLIAQCNALHAAMPFLFERIDDETELLLPDNLLHSDSLIRKLVNGIDEADWQEVEIIGWLYQFYISEKKDQVIGKVVKSEDIPAATQLFTPNRIVKYLVQNSLGKQWIATYPNSPLKQQMAYYIEPAEQTPEVQAQLTAITPESLNPEELTLLDPACGSGHILVEAYDLFKAIYQERGYRARDIPSLILQKNLYGLEIDDRAAQLAAFALVMKARADDRRIFSSGIQPHVLAIQDSKGLDAQQITKALNVPILKTQRLSSEYLFEELEEERAPLFSRKNLSVEGDIAQADVAQLIALFEYGKTFGSLIRVPEELAKKLPAIAERVQDVLAYGGMLEQAAARLLMPFLAQVWILDRRYGAVVTNPPYMGSKYYTSTLKVFINRSLKSERADLYSCFLHRNLTLAQKYGFVAMITIPNWMSLPTFEDFRNEILSTSTIDSFVHNGRGVFGSDFGTCSFVLRNGFAPLYRAIYKRLFQKQGSVAMNDELNERFFETSPYISCQQDFLKIPGTPIVYWITKSVVVAFQQTQLKELAEIKAGIGTSNNDRFLRLWYEVDNQNISFNCTSLPSSQQSGKTWFPYTKGGNFRKWYGNNEYLVNWKDDGKEIKYAVVNNPFDPNTTHWSRRIFNTEYFFLPSITWSDVSVASLSVRKNDAGFMHDAVGVGAYRITSKEEELGILGILNSRVARVFTEILCPTVHFKAGQMGEIPIILPEDSLGKSVTECVQIANPTTSL
jgi:hypothetical protein